MSVTGLIAQHGGCVSKRVGETGTKQVPWGLGRKDPSPEQGSLSLWGEAGSRGLKGILFTVLLFLSLSAEKMFWEICVEMEYRSQGIVMWKIRMKFFL